jgi:hypothetical protein
MFCCTVRYSLSGGTVFLVGEYGITLLVPLRGIIEFLQDFCQKWSRSRVGRPQEEGRICRPVRYFLSGSTVSIYWPVRY